MGFNREEQMERGEREVVKDGEHSYRRRAEEGVGQLLEELGKKALKSHSCEITMQFKSLPNLPSYY